MKYVPLSRPKPVCKPGEFPFAATALDHGHIYGLCGGLIEAGAELRYVYDPDPAKLDQFCKTFPGVKKVDSLEKILEHKEIKLVAAAAIPDQRAALGIRVMQAGKDYFTDKTPFTTLDQLAEVKKAVAGTKRKYAVYYNDRIHMECSVFADQLINHYHAIGRVLQIVSLSPQRLSAETRPEWFFDKEQYGGILCDLGSHQIEQFLYFSGAHDAKILSATVANYTHPEYPELEDLGEVHLLGDNGTTGYSRVDWFTPDGLGTWGDARTIILGDKGYIELRKHTDIGRDNTRDHLFLVDPDGEYHYRLKGQVGYPFFGQLILDCIHRTEKAMSQEHIFRASELSLNAQKNATVLEGVTIGKIKPAAKKK
jgi:predicted dehydrogenase